jgi:hypothetical protein
MTGAVAVGRIADAKVRLDAVNEPMKGAGRFADDRVLDGRFFHVANRSEDVTAFGGARRTGASRTLGR